MTTKRDEYDVFLDTWEPSEILEHVTLASNLHDHIARDRLLTDSTGVGKLERTPYSSGFKIMSRTEEKLRLYDFFASHQADWSQDFRERLIDNGLDDQKVTDFIRAFSELWTDGKQRRQDSPEMMSIKAAIQQHDRKYARHHAGKFVLNEVPSSVQPTLDALEMKVIFKTNTDMLEHYLQDYITELRDDGPGSINHLYVRRGVYMPPSVLSEQRVELHYLSSYSLSLGPTEQFAQTWTPETAGNGVASIFSAPLPALQKRVVAFAPFIQGMDLRQLELVTAPPVEPTQLHYRGEYGGIHDYEFE